MNNELNRLTEKHIQLKKAKSFKESQILLNEISAIEKEIMPNLALYKKEEQR